MQREKKLKSISRINLHTTVFGEQDEGKRPTHRRTQVKVACVNCRKACKKCDEVRPCSRCVSIGIADTCVDAPRKDRKKSVLRPRKCDNSPRKNGPKPPPLNLHGMHEYFDASYSPITPVFQGYMQHMLPMNDYMPHAAPSAEAHMHGSYEAHPGYILSPQYTEMKPFDFPAPPPYLSSHQQYTLQAPQDQNLIPLPVVFSPEHIENYEDGQDYMDDIVMADYIMTAPPPDIMRQTGFHQ